MNNEPSRNYGPKQEPKLLIQSNDVDNRLAQFHLTKSLLLEAVGAAVAGRNNCTKNDPRSAPGFRSWSDGNRRLRELLFERNDGWEWDEEDNIPSALNRK